MQQGFVGFNLGKTLRSKTLMKAEFEFAPCTSEAHSPNRDKKDPDTCLRTLKNTFLKIFKILLYKITLLFIN